MRKWGRAVERLQATELPGAKAEFHPYDSHHDERPEPHKLSSDLYTCMTVHMCLRTDTEALKHTRRK